MELDNYILMINSYPAYPRWRCASRHPVHPVDSSSRCAAHRGAPRIAAKEGVYGILYDVSTTVWLSVPPVATDLTKPTPLAYQ